MELECASLQFPPVWLKLQRAVWGNEKARSRQNGASSICRLLAFSDCCAICGPQSGPAQTWTGCLPNLVAVVASNTTAPPTVARQQQTSMRNRPNLDATPASERTASAVQMVRQHHSLKTETARIELAQIRADFVFGRISEALFASRPFHQQAETTKIDISTNIAD